MGKDTEVHNPNITAEGNFTLTYFPYRLDAKPQTLLEKAIQYLYDCWEYEEEYQPHSPKTKKQLLDLINNVVLPAAKEGNQDAIHWTFFAYYYGMGVELDYGKAVEYLTLLADRGYPDMQFELGICYQNSDWSCSDEVEYERREQEAMKWFKKAAEKGNEDAIEALKFYGGNDDDVLHEDGFIPYPMYESERDFPF